MTNNIQKTIFLYILLFPVVITPSLAQQDLERQYLKYKNTEITVKLNPGSDYYQRTRKLEYDSVKVNHWICKGERSIYKVVAMDHEGSYPSEDRPVQISRQESKRIFDEMTDELGKDIGTKVDNTMGRIQGYPVHMTAFRNQKKGYLVAVRNFMVGTTSWSFIFKLYQGDLTRGEWKKRYSRGVHFLGSVEVLKGPKPPKPSQR